MWYPEFRSTAAGVRLLADPFFRRSAPPVSTVCTSEILVFRPERSLFSRQDHVGHLFGASLSRIGVCVELGIQLKCGHVAEMGGADLDAGCCDCASRITDLQPALPVGLLHRALALQNQSCTAQQTPSLRGNATRSRFERGGIGLPKFQLRR